MSQQFEYVGGRAFLAKGWLRSSGRNPSSLLEERPVASGAGARSGRAVRDGGRETEYVGPYRQVTGYHGEPLRGAERRHA